MSLQLYDESFTKKLQGVFGNVVYASPDEVFSESNKLGKVKLPLIGIYRIDNPPLYDDMYNHAEAFVGRMTRTSRDSYGKYYTLPVNLSYQIDIWCNERRQLDGIYRELLFYMVRYPNIDIDLPDAGVLSFAARLTDSIMSTDLSSTDDDYRLYRMSLTYDIPTAKLFYHKEFNWDNFTDDDGNILVDGRSIQYSFLVNDELIGIMSNTDSSISNDSDSDQ